MAVTFVTATNDQRVLNSCLLASEGIAQENEFIFQSGYSSAGRAYNDGLRKASHDLVFFAHQDLYFPPGWLRHFLRHVEALDSQTGCRWGVLGLYGVTIEGSAAGWIYSAGLRRLLGSNGGEPQRVRTLDEVLLVFRRSSGLVFDENLTGFHMYGTDICMEAERRGLSNFAVPSVAIHNSNAVGNLPIAFWRAYSFIRRKWRTQLPIYSPCAKVEALPLREVRNAMVRYFRFSLMRRHTHVRFDSVRTIEDKLLPAETLRELAN